MPVDTSAIQTVISGAAAAAGFIILRLLPVWPDRDRGCDAYNILLNAETLRKTKKLPIRMPALFMLEDRDQWYPPGFLILCALLPQKWLQKRFWVLNHLVDLASAMLIFAFSIYFGAPLIYAAAAAIIYGIMPGLANEFSVLNARPFGLLLFNAFMLTAVLADGSVPLTAVVIILAFMLFFSHKLSVQQLWFTLPVLAIATGNWYWLSLIAAIYIPPFMIWPRGAWRVLRGHYVIVRFWARNWRLLGAHAVRQSPIYGNGETRIDYYATGGPADAIRFMKDAIHQNYFVFPIMLAAILGLPWTQTNAGWAIIVWIASVYVWTSAIHFIKPLRGIGLAQQYVKFSLVPSIAGAALSFAGPFDWLVAVAVLLAVAATVRQYVLICRNKWQEERSAGTQASDENLQSMAATLSKDEDARIMCLPVHLCDLIAYLSRKKVYWGTHSDVFDDRLEAFFPVLKHNLKHYAQDGANRLLLDTRYATPEELNLDPDSFKSSAGSYRIYELDASDLPEAVSPAAT